MDRKLYDKLYKAKPFLSVILLQFGYAVLFIIVKIALNKGMNPRVLVVYRHVVAFCVIAPFALIFERKVRPKMTLPIFAKIMLLGLLEPVMDQNLYYIGMKYTTATFTSAMCNILPAFAFLMAWACRLEKVSIRKFHSQAKIMGTLVTVGGAMLMSLFNGPVLNLPWTKRNLHHQSSTSAANRQDPIKGALFIGTGCVCWSAFIILQAITLKAYPAELSLTALICLMGAMEGSVLAVAVEWRNPSVWSLYFDSRLVAIICSGVIGSGFAFYIQGVVMKQKGPVFVTAFNPLSMVMVAILSSFILSEIMYLGRVIGAIVIVTGLYIVLWGKSKDQIAPKKGMERVTSSEREMTITNESDNDITINASDNNLVAIDNVNETKLELDSG